ncbi:hypothetical protein Gotur_014446 [Gossypium turneri]
MSFLGIGLNSRHVPSQRGQVALEPTDMPDKSLPNNASTDLGVKIRFRRISPKGLIKGSSLGQLPTTLILYGSGIVRDWNGGWIFCYNKYLGSCFVFDSKLWRILDGLTFLLDRNYDRVIIQTDRLEAIKSYDIIFNEDNDDDAGLTKMIQNRRKGLQLFEDSS